MCVVVCVRKTTHVMAKDVSCAACVWLAVTKWYIYEDTHVVSCVSYQTCHSDMGPRKQLCFVRLMIHHGESTGKVKKTTFCTSVTKLRSCWALVEKERCLIHGIGDEGVGGVDNDGAGAPAVPKTNKQSVPYNYLRRISCVRVSFGCCNIIQEMKV